MGRRLRRGRPAPCGFGLVAPLDRESGTSGYGAGLRQHHFRAGKTVCLGCHGDSAPANYAPAGENVPPPYYFTPDGTHPNKPTNPCNPGGIGENFAGAANGLDNDGDGLYDGNDADCQAVAPSPTATNTAVPSTNTPVNTAVAPTNTPVNTVERSRRRRKHTMRRS